MESLPLLSVAEEQQRVISLAAAAIKQVKDTGEWCEWARTTVDGVIADTDEFTREDARLALEYAETKVTNLSSYLTSVATDMGTSTVASRLLESEGFQDLFGKSRIFASALSDLRKAWSDSFDEETGEKKEKLPRRLRRIGWYKKKSGRE